MQVKNGKWIENDSKDLSTFEAKTRNKYIT